MLLEMLNREVPEPFVDHCRGLGHIPATWAIQRRRCNDTLRQKWERAFLPLVGYWNGKTDAETVEIMYMTSKVNPQQIRVML